MILKVWKQSSDNSYSAMFVQVPAKLLSDAERYRWVWNEETNQPKATVDGKSTSLRDWVFKELGLPPGQPVEFVDGDHGNLQEDNLRAVLPEPKLRNIRETKLLREPKPPRIPKRKPVRAPRQVRVKTCVKPPTSQFRGVSKHSESHGFVARAMKRDKSAIYLGIYYTEMDAAGAVNQFLLEEFPEEVAAGKIYLNLHPKTRELLTKVEQCKHERKTIINRRRNYYRVKRSGNRGQNATSVFVGVSKKRDSLSRCWCASTSTPERKNVYLGSFENELDAARAWNKFQKENYPELIQDGVIPLNRDPFTGEILV